MSELGEEGDYLDGCAILGDYEPKYKELDIEDVAYRIIGDMGTGGAPSLPLEFTPEQQRAIDAAAATGAAAAGGMASAAMPGSLGPYYSSTGDGRAKAAPKGSSATRYPDVPLPPMPQAVLKDVEKRIPGTVPQSGWHKALWAGSPVKVWHATAGLGGAVLLTAGLALAIRK